MRLRIYSKVFVNIKALTVTLYNKVSFVNINVLTNMNEQWSTHLLQYLFNFVNVS